MGQRRGGRVGEVWGGSDLDSVEHLDSSNEIDDCLMYEYQ